MAINRTTDSILRSDIKTVLKVLFCGLGWGVFGHDAGASVAHTCGVSYESSGGWSKEYFMSTSFLSGKELNVATRSLNYSTFSVYAALWFGQGEVALVKLDRPINGAGDTFDSGEFYDLFQIFGEVEGKDQQGKKWKIRAKILHKFIDDLSPSEKLIYGIGSILGTARSSDPQASQTPIPNSDSKVGVVVLKKGLGDWFVVNSPRGFAVLEWFGGYDPEVGDIVTGNFEGYGFKNVKIRDRHTRIWVEDFWLSQERALEIYSDKTR